MLFYTIYTNLFGAVATLAASKPAQNAPRCGSPAEHVVRLPARPKPKTSKSTTFFAGVSQKIVFSNLASAYTIKAEANNMNDVRLTKQTQNIPTYIPKKAHDLPMFFEHKPYQGASGRLYPIPYADGITDEKNVLYENSGLQN